MIRLKTESDLQKLRESGKILASILKTLKNEAVVGVSLKRLDEIAVKLLKEAGAKAAFLGYKPEGAVTPYPASLCVSVNNQIVHSLPSGHILKEGDILTIDFGVDYGGYITDAAITFGIGNISSVASKLIGATEKALEKAIKVCIPGNSLGDIGWVIERTVKSAGFNVVKGLTGHGVGFKLHEEPTVHNYGSKREGLKLKEGMVLAIEPITSAGSGAMKQLPDDSYVTSDDSLSAHFEHTVAIRKNGPEILTA